MVQLPDRVQLHQAYRNKHVQIRGRHQLCRGCQPPLHTTSRFVMHRLLASVLKQRIKRLPTLRPWRIANCLLRMTPPHFLLPILGERSVQLSVIPLHRLLQPAYY